MLELCDAWLEGGGRADTLGCEPWNPPNHTRQSQLGRKLSVKLKHMAERVEYLCPWLLKSVAHVSIFHYFFSIRLIVYIPI
jgi:hypothetical protein